MWFRGSAWREKAGWLCHDMPWARGAESEANAAWRQRHQFAGAALTGACNLSAAWVPWLRGCCPRASHHSHLCLTGDPKPSSELKESLWDPRERRSQLPRPSPLNAAAASSRSSSTRRRPLARPTLRMLSARGESCTQAGEQGGGPLVDTDTCPWPTVQCSMRQLQSAHTMHAMSHTNWIESDLPHLQSAASTQALLPRCDLQ